VQLHEYASYDGVGLRDPLEAGEVTAVRVEVEDE
jgi:hypothetical protein